MLRVTVPRRRLCDNRPIVGREGHVRHVWMPPAGQVAQGCDGVESTGAVMCPASDAAGWPRAPMSFACECLINVTRSAAH